MSYNFFIPINEEAEQLWKKYQDLSEIEEYFKRKTAIKLLMPELMKYVVRIPDYVHPPDPEDREKALIYDEGWTSFYDERFGYKKSEIEAAVEIF